MVLFVADLIGSLDQSAYFVTPAATADAKAQSEARLKLNLSRSLSV